MTINRYRITTDNPDIPHEQSWLIAALTAQSAWAKFSTQYFGVLKPKRADYTVTFASHH